MKKKCECGGDLAGHEYAYGDKYRYDGVSELFCLDCSTRYGRWCGEELTGNMVERPFCTGGAHPLVMVIEQPKESETNYSPQNTRRVD